MRTALLLVFAIATIGLIGCQRYAKITHTQFQVSDFRGSTKTVQGKLKKIRMRLDRKANKVTLTQANGSEVVIPVEVRSEDKWMRGCPRSSRTKMEVIDLKVPQVVIGRFTIQDPVLQAASCASGSGFFLRESKQVKSVDNWKCQMAQMCLRFAPVK